jgi:small subunit ribosomal protein S3
VGHKVHPYGFRIGIIRGWKAKWYDEKHYLEVLHDDLKLRREIKYRLREGAVTRVEMDRQGNDVLVTVFTARPGIVIGRGGQRAEELRSQLEKLCGKKVKLSIKEVEQPETEAALVARNIADSLERRVAFRRAMKQEALKSPGVKLSVKAGYRCIRCVPILITALQKPLPQWGTSVSKFGFTKATLFPK